MEDFSYPSFEVLKKIGLLSEHDRGWRREVNIVSWNQREPKLDIRDWADEHTRMGRGISLTQSEAEKLYDLLGGYLCPRQ